MLKTENRRISVLFVVNIMCILVGAVNPALTYPMLAVAALIALVLGTYYMNYPNIDACLGIICMLVFQNFALGIGAHIGHNASDSLSYLTQIPFITIAAIWIMQLMTDIINKRIGYNIALFVGLLIMILISCFNGIGAVGSVLVNIRNLTVFYMVFQIGYNCINTETERSELINKFLILAKIVLVAGIILLLGGYKLYHLIGVDEVYIAKGVPYAVGQLDGRFETSILGKSLNRMGSLYYEPVNLAYFFSIATLISWFANWTDNRLKKLITTVLMVLGLFLCYGKGGWLLTTGVVGCVYIYRLLTINNNSSLKRVLSRIIIICAVIIGVIFCMSYYQKDQSSVAPHFWGLINTWNVVVKNPCGFGIGTGGNMAHVFAKEATSLYGEWMSMGAETALMSFLYQIGFIGVAFFIGCMLSLSTNGEKDRDEMYIFIPIMLIAISLLQDNTFTPQCISVFMLFQGGAKRLADAS